MPPTRRTRFSNGVPWTSAPAEQKAFYEEAKRDPEIREAIERVTGVDFDDLTYQTFRTTYNAWVSAGFAKAEFVAIAEADQKVRRIGAALSGEMSKDAKIASLEEEIRTLRETVQAEVAASVAEVLAKHGLLDPEPVIPAKKGKVSA